MEFGFTNDKEKIETVRKWRDTAIADGWSHKPTYGTNEPEERACSLEKDGFKALVLTRDNTKASKKWQFEAEVSVWGPDGLSLPAGEVYIFDALKKALRHCPICGKDDVETKRYSFAGRCCSECLPDMRKKHEYPGWCD